LACPPTLGATELGEKEMAPLPPSSSPATRSSSARCEGGTTELLQQHALFPFKASADGHVSLSNHGLNAECYMSLRRQFRSLSLKARAACVGATARVGL
jgi:hypothetical protein